MEELDATEKAVQIERRKVYNKASHEAFLRSLEEAAAQRKVEAKSRREAAMADAEQKKIERMLERERNHRFATEVRSVEVSLPAEKRAVVLKERSESASRVRTVLAKDREHCVTQKRHALYDAKEKIARLRAQDKFPVCRNKPEPFDPTESSGLGMLGEMSVAELKEQLELLAEHKKELAEKKREKIQAVRERDRAAYEKIKDLVLGVRKMRSRVSQDYIDHRQ